MENNYAGGIVPLASDLSYLNGGDRYRDGDRVWAGAASNAARINRNESVTRDRSDVVGEKINCAQNVAETGIEGIYRTLQFGRVDDQFTRLCNRVGDMELRVSDNLIAAERRNDDKLAAIVKEQGESSKENLKQFCDLKELHRETQKTIEVTALSQENRDLRDKLEEERVNRCCPPRCTPVDPCCGGSNNGSAGDVAAAVVNALAPALNSIASAIAGLSSGPGNSGN